MIDKPMQGNLRRIITMLVVDDLDASIAFYRDVLGFDVTDMLEHIAMIERDATAFYLFTHSPPTPDKPGVTLANLNTPDSTPVVIDFHVDDCRAAYQELRARGVEFLTPPHQPPWGGWRCFAKDPNGYLIEIEDDSE